MILIFAYRKSTTVLSKRINRNVLTCLYAGYRIEIHTRAQGWIVYTCAQHTPAPVLCSFVLEMLMCPVTRELLSGAAAVPPTPPPLFATTVNYTDLWCNTMSRERENGELDLPGHCNRSPASKARENIYTRTAPPNIKIFFFAMSDGRDVKCYI